MTIATIYSNLSADLVRSLLSFSSTDPSREHLCSVHFDPKGRSLVATDGCRLVRVEIAPSYAEDDAESFTVPRDVIAAALKHAGRGGTIEVEHERAQMRVSIVARPRKNGPSATFAAELIADKFPPYRQVIPTPEGDDHRPSHHWVNPEFLVDMAALANALRGQRGGSPSVRLTWCADELSPILYRVDGDALADVVIMPMRGPK